jgi:hypothetical protein
MVAKDCNGYLVIHSADAELTDPDKISENGAELTQAVARIGAPVPVSLTIQSQRENGYGNIGDDGTP